MKLSDCFAWLRRRPAAPSLETAEVPHWVVYDRGRRCGTHRTELAAEQQAAHLENLGGRPRIVVEYRDVPTAQLREEFDRAIRERARWARETAEAGDAENERRWRRANGFRG